MPCFAVSAFSRLMLGRVGGENKCVHVCMLFVLINEC